MLISKKHNFIFVHIYKNAGTSIKHALMPFAQYQWQWITHKMLKKAGISLPFLDPSPFRAHIKTSEIIDCLGPEKFKSYFSFAIVRNPWDWQVSLYNYILKAEKHHQHALMKRLGSFEKYIKWRCENEVSYQKDYIYSENNELLVNYVGRYENLDVDFDKICSNIGISTSLPKLNVSNKIPYQQFYNETTKNLIKRTFEPDIELFEYDF